MAGSGAKDSIIEFAPNCELWAISLNSSWTWKSKMENWLKSTPHGALFIAMKKIDWNQSEAIASHLYDPSMTVSLPVFLSLPSRHSRSMENMANRSVSLWRPNRWFDEKWGILKANYWFSKLGYDSSGTRSKWWIQVERRNFKLNISSSFLAQVTHQLLRQRLS